MSIGSYILKLFNPKSAKLKSTKSNIHETPRWVLLVGEELLGEFVYGWYETPWVTADFSPSERFNYYLPYFEWKRLMNEKSEDSDDSDGEDDEFTPVEQIEAINAAGGLVLLEVRNGERLKNPTIHFSSDYSYATFR